MKMIIVKLHEKLNMVQKEMSDINFPKIVGKQNYQCKSL